MTDARKLLEDYHSYSSGADSAEGARLHMTTAALLAVLDLHKPGGRFVGSQERYCSACGLGMPCPCPTVLAINKALGVTDE